MGSGSSSNIKAIHIDQKDEPSEVSPKKKSNVPSPGKEISDFGQHSEALKQDGDKDAVIETLTKQLCESESQRLDLEDHVETLVKELDYLNSQNLEREGEQKPCEETVHAKDQYITKLEREKKDLETEVSKMKQKQRRKQKQFNTQIAENKQEVNFQIMELKEEINRLKANNKVLAESKPGQGRDIAMKFQAEEETPKLPGGEKMALILELSEQVAEQQDKIQKLEYKLNEKDQIVNDLRTKLKNSAQYLSVINKTNEGKTTNEKHSTVDGVKQIGDKNNFIDKGSKSSLSRNLMQKNDKNPLKYEPHGDGLFTVDEESSENEEESLVKLSSYLNGVKSCNKDRMSPVQSEERKVTISTSGHLSEPFEDLEANNGRDSGFGSAGNREEKVDRKTESFKSDRIGTDWKDIAHSFDNGSGLSDSDFEQYGPGQSKVSSAPPKLQNQGVRHKKKSNSLKRHASSRREDRPPRPGVAFVSSAGTLHTDDHIVNKLSPIISPVEVS